MEIRRFRFFPAIYALASGAVLFFAGLKTDELLHRGLENALRSGLPFLIAIDAISIIFIYKNAKAFVRNPILYHIFDEGVEADSKFLRWSEIDHISGRIVALPSGKGPERLIAEIAVFPEDKTIMPLIIRCETTDYSLADVVAHINKLSAAAAVIKASGGPDTIITGFTSGKPYRGI